VCEKISWLESLSRPSGGKNVADACLEAAAMLMRHLFGCFRDLAVCRALAVADTVFMASELLGYLVQAHVQAGVHILVVMAGYKRVLLLGVGDDLDDRSLSLLIQDYLDGLDIVVEAREFGDFCFDITPN